MSLNVFRAHKSLLSLECVSNISLANSINNSYKDILNHHPKIPVKRMNDFYIDMIVRLITNEKGLKYVEEQILKD